MHVLCGYKTKLDLNNAQRTACARHAGAARYAYNWGLACKLAAYQAGEKTPIGQIVPIKASVEGRLNAMVAAGLAEWNGQKLKPYKPKAINRGDGQVSDLVVENRQ